MFITFEGTEGTGKSTQARRLADWFRARGAVVWLTREPGGTPLAEAIRRVVLQPELVLDALRAAGTLPPAGALDDAVTPIAELLLMSAARSQLVAAIRQRIAAGEIVICDRYADATRAYQGGGRGLDHDQIEAVIAIATSGLTPDLTILLDADPALGLGRKHRQADAAEWNRMDSEDLPFHQRVRARYRVLAAADPARWLLLDAAAPVEQIADQISAALATKWRA